MENFKAVIKKKKTIVVYVIQNYIFGVNFKCLHRTVI